MKITSLLTLALLFASGISSFALTTVPAPAFSKLKVPALSSGAGAVVAVGESYILAGSPTSVVNGISNAGDVQVFRVSDGAFVRRLISPNVTAGGSFGQSVAVYGGVAYVGAPGEAPSAAAAGSGAVHAIDIATGKRVWTQPGLSGQALGFSMSISGDRIAVGAPKGYIQGNPVGSGSVSVLTRKTGAKITVLTMNGAAANDHYGHSVCLNGNVVAVGAPQRDVTGKADAGAVTLTDLETLSPIALLTSGDPESGDKWGYALAMNSRVLAIGIPGYGLGDEGDVMLFNLDGSGNKHTQLDITGSKREFGRSLAAAGNLFLVGGLRFGGDGEAFLFDINDSYDDGVEVAVHTAADAENLGVAVAMTEQTLIIGDDAQPISGNSKGAVWVGRSPKQMLNPYYRYARTNEPADNTGGALYASFADQTLLENNGTVMFRAGLKGTGVTTANNSGVFNDWSTSTPDLIIRKGEKVGGKTVSALGRMFFTPSSWAWPVIQSTTGGVTSIFRDDAPNTRMDFQVGSAPAVAGTAGTIANIRALTCAATDEGTATFVYDAKIGVDGTTAANDSRIALFDRTVMGHRDSIREGGSSPEMGRVFGQIQPRIAASSTHFVYSAALSGDTLTNAGVFVRKIGAASTTVAQKGKPAPGTTSNFASFIGEGVNESGTVILRATTSSGREGLWLKTTAGSLSKVIIKGDQAPGTPIGVKFSRFNRFFISNAHVVMFSATLTGPGVTTANDQGVWVKKGATTSLILREGDAAPGCDSARVSAITGLDLGTKNSYYTLLVSLTGSTTTNQALYFGEASLAAPALFQPALSLRKGAWIDKAGGQRITNLSIGTHNIATSGSGTHGNVRLISDIGALVKVTYSDTQQELMCIRP